jgi:hypothetical protein
MPGLTDYTATALLNWATGAQGMPAIASRYLGLFTTAPTSDSGVTGATEVSGGSYARVQIAGALAVSGSSGAPSTGSATFTLAATAPAWLLALGTNGSGVNVYDATGSVTIGTVSSISGTTVTLTGNSAHNGSLSDSLLFSAFPLASNSSGSEPATTPANSASGAAIAFAQSSGSWGTVTSFGVFDALTSGNLLWWDYLGNYKWSPFSCTSASPGVLTCTDQTFVNGQYAVVTAKFGGTLPTTGGSWAGILTVAGVSGSTFNLGVNTTGSGDGLVRQVIQQPVGRSTTVTFAPGQLTLTGA